jgi:hypothetical protein
VPNWNGEHGTPEVDPLNELNFKPQPNQEDWPFCLGPTSGLKMASSQGHGSTHLSLLSGVTVLSCLRTGFLVAYSWGRGGETSSNTSYSIVSRCPTLLRETEVQREETGLTSECVPEKTRQQDDYEDKEESKRGCVF